MKILNRTTPFLALTIAASTGFADDYSIVSAEKNSQIQAFNQRVIHSEETEISKQYMTALAIDGMKRLYETGLEFVGKDPSTAIRRLEAVKTLVQCAFDYALIANNEMYWSDSYSKCVMDTNLITGNLNNDQVRVLSFYVNGNEPDPRFYKPSSRVNVNSWFIPGPLALIHWTMDRIGSVGLKLSERQKEEFLSEIKKVVGLIEARSELGPKAFISEMEVSFTKLQRLIDSTAKSNTNKETNVLNLMNLRLTREGVAKVGQVAFEEANRAQSSRILEPEKAKELALFVLKHNVISALVSLQAGTDLRDYLDEVVTGFDQVHAKFTSLDSKAPIRMAAKTMVAQRTLAAYGFNDMNGILNVDIEAAPLKDAFKIGRILGENAKTSEYDPVARATVRAQQAEERRQQYLRSTPGTQTQNLQISAGTPEKEEL